MEGIEAPNSLVQELNIKEEFIQIGQAIIGEQLSKETVHHLDQMYLSFFEKHDLNEFRFRIDYDIPKNSVTFVPLRKIDQLALRGLLTL